MIWNSNKDVLQRVLFYMSCPVSSDKIFYNVVSVLNKMYQEQLNSKILKFYIKENERSIKFFMYK